MPGSRTASRTTGRRRAPGRVQGGRGGRCAATRRAKVARSRDRARPQLTPSRPRRRHARPRPVAMASSSARRLGSPPVARLLASTPSPRAHPADYRGRRRNARRSGQTAVSIPRARVRERLRPRELVRVGATDRRHRADGARRAGAGLGTFFRRPRRRGTRRRERALSPDNGATRWDARSQASGLAGVHRPASGRRRCARRWHRALRHRASAHKTTVSVVPGG
jgi:hypothetical protein